MEQIQRHVRHGLESVGDLVRRNHGHLVVSKYRLRQADGIALIRSNHEERKQSLCFSSRPFVLCGLPMRRLPPDQLLYERRNGNFVLQITGHPDYGVPFGQDRIVPIFLATLAVKHKSPVVRFESASEMLATFGLHNGGKEYPRLVAAFERIFGATIFFGTDRLSGRARVIQRSRFNFFREAQLWYQRGGEALPLSRDFENTIVLSEEFYAEVMAHPIPTDLEAVKVLSASPAVLSYRCFFAKAEESIPIFGEYGLAAQLGSVDYSRPRRFRAMLDQWLGSVHAIWPECPAVISHDGRRLLINRGTAIAEH